MSHDWYQQAPQLKPVDTPDLTHPRCPRCDQPVYDPGIWVVKGGDYCSRDCAAQAGGHL